MEEWIRANLLELSDASGFRFSLCCSVCGRVWVSETTPFSDIGRRQTARSRALYEREREEAMSRAVSEALRGFEVCLLCGKITGKECLEELGEMTVCRSCAERLKKQL